MPHMPAQLYAIKSILIETIPRKSFRLAFNIIFCFYVEIIIGIKFYGIVCPSIFFNFYFVKSELNIY